MLKAYELAVVLNGRDPAGWGCAVSVGSLFGLIVHHRAEQLAEVARGHKGHDHWSVPGATLTLATTTLVRGRDASI